MRIKANSEGVGFRQTKLVNASETDWIYSEFEKMDVKK